jgi:hypothetical protein
MQIEAKDIISVQLWNTDGGMINQWEEIDKNRGNFKLLSHFWVKITTKYFVHYLLVPSYDQHKWTHDLASDPLHRIGTWDYAAVVHDWLYQNKGVDIMYQESLIIFTRDACDKIFYLLMDEATPDNLWYWIRNNAAWAGVRLFGGSYWDD